MAIGGFLKDLISPVTELIGKAVVDKDEARRLQFEVEKLADQADARIHEQLMGQIEINKTEAQHHSVFVAGWRPFIGWTSGVGLAYSFVAAPFIEFIARANGYTQEMPMPDASTLLTLVLAMLGVGGMRSFEKLKQVDTKSVGKPKND